jgi:hypothetical protein
MGLMFISTDGGSTIYTSSREWCLGHRHKLFGLPNSYTALKLSASYSDRSMTPKS